MTDTSREQRLVAAFVKVADTLTADFDVIELMDGLLQECTTILDVQEGGLMLADGGGDLQLMASTSEQALFVEMMQLGAGSGPSFDCFTSGRAVSVSDIDGSGELWPEFRVASLERGFHSVHVVPMRLRGQILGTMNLFGLRDGALSEQDATAAQALADVATIGILQERAIRETGMLADQLQRALGTRILIEQAKGVLLVTGAGSLEEAFSTMRGYARQNNLTLREVAEAVTARRLRMVESVLTD